MKYGSRIEDDRRPRVCVWALWLAAAAMAALMATGILAGCAADASQEAAPAQEQGRAMSQQALPEEEVGDVSQAMVVMAGDQPLFVNTATEAPYYPTIPDGALTDADGNAIAPSQLEVGNIVEVTGNGIMLESYPGQYPGITAVRVLEKGLPTDAAKYNDLVEQLSAQSDSSAVPFASIGYRTDLADTSLLLEPAAYTWQSEGAQAETKELDILSASGQPSESLNDARISDTVDAAVLFDMVPTGVAVTRMPLVATSNGHAVDSSVQEEAVQVSLNGPEAHFSMAPDSLYVVTATYDAGQVVYAFVALPPRQ